MRLTVLTLLAFVVRAVALARFADPPGMDGYYYVVQLRDLAATGVPHVPDSSFVLRLLCLPVLAGLDPVLGLAVGAAALAALCVPAAHAAGSAISERAALGLACFAAVSPTLTHLAADFPKSLGAVPLLWLAWALAQRRGWRWLCAAIGAAGLAAVAHRLGAVTVGLAVAGIGFAWLVRPSAHKGRVVAVLLALGAFGTALWAQQVPGLLHPADLDRLTGALRGSPWPPPPWSWVHLRQPSPWQLAELAIVPWSAVLLAAVRVRSLGPATLALLVPLVVCLFPFWQADTLDLGFRLSLWAVPLGATLLAALLPQHSVSPGWMLLALPAVPTGIDLEATPPYSRYRALFARIPRPLPELLITPPGASFLYDHLTGKEAMSWAPEPDLPRNRVGRMAFGIRDGEWIAYTPVDADAHPVRLDADYVFVREDLWEGFVLAATAQGDEDLLERIADPRNPSRVRPGWLVRGRNRPATPAVPARR